MLAFAPSSSPHQFLPAIPSPLSPRSANIYGRRPARENAMSSSKETPKPIFNTTPVNSSSTSSVPFSKRLIKKAPSPNQNELKERRRSNFLRKVRDNREDKRFEARGEDIMRMDFMQRRRAYEAELARSAPSLPSDPIEEDEDAEYELPGWSQQGSQMQISSQRAPDEEADEFEREEEGELMALLEYMPGEEEMEGQEKEREESLWSDDADYDALFSEVMMEQENAAPQGEAQTVEHDGEEMDMS